MRPFRCLHRRFYRENEQNRGRRKSLRQHLCGLKNVKLLTFTVYTPVGTDLRTTLRQNTTMQMKNRI